MKETSPGIIGLYDADGERAGSWCPETGRAQLGMAFYVQERTCRNIDDGSGFECNACGYRIDYCTNVQEVECCPSCGAKVAGTED